MRIIRLADAPDLIPAWDRFVDAHRFGTFWHTSAWLAYQRAYRPENSDESFALLDAAGSVVAVAPLVVSKGADGEPEFSLSGTPTPRVLFRSRNDRYKPTWVLGIIENERTRIAKRYGVGRGVFGGWATDGDGNVDSPISQRLIDLTQPEATLWRDVRKSYKALIHRGEERFAVGISDSVVYENGFGHYEALHRRLYAEPRPDATYYLQYEWLQRGAAVVVLALPPGREVVGAAYWLIYKGSADYASGAYAEDNVAHAVVWRSLLALKARGVRSTVMAWRGLERTEKERGVTHFKVGFGGVDVPVAVVEVSYA